MCKYRRIDLASACHQQKISAHWKISDRRFRLPFTRLNASCCSHLNRICRDRRRHLICKFFYLNRILIRIHCYKRFCYAVAVRFNIIFKVCSDPFCGVFVPHISRLFRLLVVKIKIHIDHPVRRCCPSAFICRNFDRTFRLCIDLRPCRHRHPDDHDYRKTDSQHFFPNTACLFFFHFCFLVH